MPSLSIYVTREIYDYLSELAGKDRTPEAEGKRWIEERYKTEKRGLMKLEKEEKEEDAN